MTQSVKGLNWTELVSPRVGLPSGIPLCLKNTFCKTCIHLSGGDEDYFSHPRVVGAGSVYGCADGCQSQSMLRRFCGSMDRGWPEHMVRGSLALAFLACLLSSAGAVLLALHILQEKLQGNPAQKTILTQDHCHFKTRSVNSPCSCFYAEDYYASHQTFKG